MYGILKQVPDRNILWLGLQCERRILYLSDYTNYQQLCDSCGCQQKVWDVCYSEWTFFPFTNFHLIEFMIYSLFIVLYVSSRTSVVEFELSFDSLSVLSYLYDKNLLINWDFNEIILTILRLNLILQALQRPPLTSYTILDYDGYFLVKLIVLKLIGKNWLHKFNELKKAISVQILSDFDLILMLKDILLSLIA